MFVSFSTTDYVVGEGNGMVFVCLVKTGRTTQSFSVDVTASESSPVEAEGESILMQVLK